MGLATAITAAATVGGALIGSNASKKAAGKVADATDQQIQLARDIYQDQRNLNQPFYQTGVQANAAAAQLLGLGAYGGQPAQTAQYGGVNPTGTGAPQSGDYRTGFEGRLTNNPLSTPYGANSKMTPPGADYGEPRRNFGDKIGVDPNNGYAIGGARQNPLSNGNPQLNALQDTPGYQFRMNEGMRALEGSAAARGGVLSGKFIRGATRYGQDYASNEYNRRFNQLQALQSGGQAAAGNTQAAGSQYGATAGSAIGNNAAYSANATQQRGSIYGGALGQIGGILGDIV